MHSFLIRNYNLPKENSFTFLRYIFCFFVIFDHFEAINQFPFHTGIGRNLSVPFFFILSGFWVTLSFLRSSTLIEYIKKRILRIFPIYLSVILLVSFFFVFLSSYSVSEYFMNSLFYKYIFCNFFTLGFLCNSLPGIDVPFGINGALWTIKIEIAFYIFLPIFIWFVEKICSFCKNKYHFLLLENSFILIIYMFSVFINVFIPTLILKYSFPSSLNNQFPSLLCFFLAGVFCLVNFDFIFVKGKLLLLPCFIVVILYIKFKYSILFFLYPLALSVLVVYLGAKISFFSKLKDYTYGMYLCHFPLLNVFYLKKNLVNFPIIYFIYIFVLCFFISFILEKFYRWVLK